MAAKPTRLGLKANDTGACNGRKLSYMLFSVVVVSLGTWVNTIIGGALQIVVLF